MKLTVLVDNNTFIDQYYLGEPAVSYYIEDEEIRPSLIRVILIYLFLMQSF